jgi:hypothetical protein
MRGGKNRYNPEVENAYRKELRREQKQEKIKKEARRRNNVIQQKKTSKGK